MKKDFPPDYKHVPHWIPLSDAPINCNLYMGDFETNRMGMGTIKNNEIKWIWSFKGIQPTHYWSF